MIIQTDRPYIERHSFQLQTLSYDPVIRLCSAQSIPHFTYPPVPPQRIQVTSQGLPFASHYGNRSRPRWFTGGAFRFQRGQDGPGLFPQVKTAPASRKRPQRSPARFPEPVKSRQELTSQERVIKPEHEPL
jgi:hypothetical protein